jgi:quercetin dioxygenase-like cupin family protein
MGIPTYIDVSCSDMHHTAHRVAPRAAHGCAAENQVVCAPRIGSKRRESQAMSETIKVGGLELRFLQTKEETAGSLDAFEMTVQPNARMPVAHYHESWDETIYGLSGASTWRVDGQDVVLEPGQSIFIKRGIVHAFRNDTQEAASCLCILTPGVLGPGYFREIAALLAGGAPDPAKMKAIMLRHGLHPAAQ